MASKNYRGGSSGGKKQQRKSSGGGGSSNAYVRFAAQMAKKWGVPVGVFLAQISQESGFNPNARSSAGAEGIGQFMPGTWAGLIRRYGMQGASPWDPYAAIQVMARYMGGLIRQYGNLQDPLSVYNSGQPWRVGQGIAQTNAYVHSILSNASRYGSTGFNPAQIPATGGTGGGGAGSSLSAPAPVTGGSNVTIGPSASDLGALSSAESSLPAILSPGSAQQATSGPQQAPSTWQMLASQPLVDAETQSLFQRVKMAGG